jgi:SAM-dependent methyltransferase
MPQNTHVSPDAIFDALTAYQLTAALKAAIELDLFSVIGDQRLTAADLAERCTGSERGVRILCDYLVTTGFLDKEGGAYGLTDVSAAFLRRESPQYMGSIAGFLASTHLRDLFSRPADAVRRGGTVFEQGSVSPDHPMWVDFARAMAPMMGLPAQLMADELKGRLPAKPKVLDIAAGHGVFGVTIGQRFPEADVVAVDWKNVLAVAEENARRAGLNGRFRSLPGSAFETPFGEGFDVVLITNFLHHFDHPTNVALLKKVAAALKPGGIALSLEFVPNEDRVSPPIPARFSFVMLNSTPAGDAYTVRELTAMHREAGFRQIEVKALPPTPQSLVVAQK